ncbi:MAG: hypothetical protein Q8K55_06065 [Gemmatimonadaceae bacterium]|nr:hypothetical protein [Gemmatimonadaceae bacterium]
MFAICAFLAAASVAGAQARTDVGSYSGSLRGTGGARGTSMMRASDASRLAGTAEIRPSSTQKEGVYTVKVRLTSTGGMSATNTLQWTIAPGRCGARLQPLVPPTEVSPLEVRSGGDADASWEGTINFAPGGSYQLVVFGMGGVREQDVMACANLKYNKPMK